jgi:predicted KAP-like P-loop ATPase
MWSDNETEIDLLGFEYLADAVVSVVRRDDLLPATIGVYGDWGGGKSSLLRIVKNKLEEDNDVVVLSFNGWLFEDYENAKTALMGSILEELHDHRNLAPEVKDKVKSLLKRVNGLKLAVGLSTGMLPLVASGGWDFLSLFAALKENAKGVEVGELKGIIDEKKKEEDEEEDKRRRQIREFRKDFQKLLEESDIKRLVVIIDDLDRCLPDTIIDTLATIAP